MCIRGVRAPSSPPHGGMDTGELTVPQWSPSLTSWLREPARCWQSRPATGGECQCPVSRRSMAQCRAWTGCGALQMRARRHSMFSRLSCSSLCLISSTTAFMTSDDRTSTLPSSTSAYSFLVTSSLAAVSSARKAGAVFDGKQVIPSVRQGRARAQNHGFGGHLPSSTSAFFLRAESWPAMRSRSSLKALMSCRRDRICSPVCF